MKALMRRKRLSDGTFGELEKVMGGETNDEKLERLEAENTVLLNAVTSLFEMISEGEVQEDE